jgi:hypothetical protein
MTVPGPGDNFALWVSEANEVPLIDQAIYQIRLSLNTDQTATDAIPVFTFTYDNFQPDVGGFMNYGGERWIWDATAAGGANGIGRPQGRSEFAFLFAPLSIDLVSWRHTNPHGSSAFDAVSDGVNDLRLAFRVLDLGGGVDPLVATADSGTICVESASFSVIPLATALARAESIYGPPLNDGIQSMDPQPQPDRTHFANSDFNVANYPNVRADIVRGEWIVTLGEVPNGGVLVRATMGPDVYLGGPIVLPSGHLNPLRYYPISWETDGFYMTQADVRAGEGSSIDPVDVIIMNHETFGLELGGLDFILPRGGDLSSLPERSGPDGGGMVLAGAPPAGEPETLYHFFYGNNVTANPNAIPGAEGWKAQIDLFNRADLGGGPTSGQDEIIFSRLETFRVNMNPR